MAVLIQADMADSRAGPCWPAKIELSFRGAVSCLGPLNPREGPPKGGQEAAISVVRDRGALRIAPGIKEKVACGEPSSILLPATPQYLLGGPALNRFAV